MARGDDRVYVIGGYHYAADWLATFSSCQSLAYNYAT